MEYQSHYPDFDLLNDINEWDEHTREIVIKRLGPFGPYKFFNADEAKIIKSITQVLIADDREAILNYIITHYDQLLVSPIGEGQRALNVPTKDLLVRQGLQSLQYYCRNKFGKDFYELDVSQKISILKELEQGAVEDFSFAEVPPREFFNNLKTNVVSAYYSHPTVWSEIGYGGPAYPRGYVRIELGLTDPWEARSDGK